MFPARGYCLWYIEDMKKQSLSQVRIYQADRNKFAVEAKKRRTTIAAIIHELFTKKV